MVNMKLMSVFLVSMFLFSGVYVAAEGTDILEPFYNLLGSPVESIAGFVAGTDTASKSQFYARFMIFLVVFSLFYVAINLVFTKVMDSTKKGPQVAIALGLAIISAFAMPISLIRLVYQAYGLLMFILFFGAIFGLLAFVGFIAKGADGKTHPWVAFTLNLLFFLFFSAMKTSLLKGGDNTLWDSMQGVEQVGTILTLVYTVLFIGLFVTGARAISTTFGKKGEDGTPLDQAAAAGVEKGKDFISKKIEQGKQKKEKATKQRNDDIVKALNIYFQDKKRANIGASDIVTYLVDSKAKLATKKRALVNYVRAIMALDTGLPGQNPFDQSSSAWKYYDSIKRSITSVSGVVEQISQNFDTLKTEEEITEENLFKNVTTSRNEIRNLFRRFEKNLDTLVKYSQEE